MVKNHLVIPIIQRRERDSNPWNAMRSTVFETAPIDHSGISPGISGCGLRHLAETEGFEPPKPFGLTVFKTAAIDHSAISPLQKYKISPSCNAVARKKSFFEALILILVVDNQLFVKLFVLSSFFSDASFLSPVSMKTLSLQG